MITLQQAERIVQLAAEIAATAQREALINGGPTLAEKDASPQHHAAVSALGHYLADLVEPSSVPPVLQTFAEMEAQNPDGFRNPR